MGERTRYQIVVSPFLFTLGNGPLPVIPARVMTGVGAGDCQFITGTADNRNPVLIGFSIFQSASFLPETSNVRAVFSHWLLYYCPVPLWRVDGYRLNI